VSAQMSRERALEPFVEMSFAFGEGGAIDWCKKEPAMPIVKFKWTERRWQFAAASTVGRRAGWSA
jgi:hypothetical protein